MIDLSHRNKPNEKATIQSLPYINVETPTIGGATDGLDHRWTITVYFVIHSSSLKTHIHST